METINPVKDTSGKSCNYDLRQSENHRPGLLAELGPFSPSPPRAAAVAHQLHQNTEKHFFATHLATPGGNGANNEQTMPWQENPLHDLSWEHMVEALDTSVYAQFGCIPSPPSCLWDIDVSISQAGPGQEYPPVDERPGPAPSNGQIGTTFFDEALQAPSGGAGADLFDWMAHRLLSDDYEVHDPEDPNVLAMMTDYEAAILDAGAPSPTCLAQGHPSVGENPGLAPPTGQVSASSCNMKSKNRISRLSTDQRRAILHIFETDSKRSNLDIADEFGVTQKTIRELREKFNRTGDIKRGDHTNRLSADQRRAMLHIFKTDSKRNNQSLADEFGVTRKTIRLLRERFNKTGDINRGDHAKPLTADQRRALLHIFETDPKRSNRSIADEFGISCFTIALSRRRLDTLCSKKTVDHAKRLSADQRQALFHIFETDAERSSQGIADEFGVSLSTINRLRKRFNKTGNIKPGNYAKRLSADQRQALLHIFETDPERGNQSVADEVDFNLNTIQTLKRQFSKTGDIEPGTSAKRLTADQRKALSHIFETDIKRSNQSLAAEFGVSPTTINRLRKRFSKTGDIEPGDYTKSLTAEQRKAILYILETDPERTIRRIAAEFDVNLKTIQVLRRQFRTTGNIKPKAKTKRLTPDQRQAISHIFETNPKRGNQSIAGEFGVSSLTIYRLRRKLGKT